MTQGITTSVDELESDETTSISRTIYRAVARAKGVDPLDLPPLAESIDGESLEQFVNRSSVDVAFSLSFEYADCSVTVTESEISVEANEEG